MNFTDTERVGGAMVLLVDKKGGVLTRRGGWKQLSGMEWMGVVFWERLYRGKVEAL